jgi:hypothetical protein
VEIKDVELHGIKMAKKSDTRMKVTMKMNRGLKSHFTAQNVFTKSKASVNFDKKIMFQMKHSDYIIISK